MMKIIRIYNNNVVHAKLNGKEIIAIGRGLAYGSKTDGKIDEAKAEKIFELNTSFSLSYITSLFSNMSIDFLIFMEEVVKYIEEEFDIKVRTSALIALYDHIYVAKENAEKNISVPGLMTFELQRYYRKEYSIAEKIVEMINRKLDIKLNKSETGFITIHLIDCQMNKDIHFVEEVTDMIDQILKIVKKDFKIDENEIDYERFVTHLRFFSERVINNNHNEKINTSFENQEIFETFQLRYIKQYKCVKKIIRSIKKTYSYSTPNEEQLYLLIHIVKAAA